MYSILIGILAGTVAANVVFVAVMLYYADGSK